MEITITKGSHKQLSPHFNESEFYSTSSDAPASHPFHTELVAAAEYLRNRFGVAWRITSTFRTEAHERRICAKQGKPYFISQHYLARAFDSQPGSEDAARNAEIMKELAADFVANGPIYQDLRKLGINGLGLYPTFIHLDVRADHRPFKDAFGLVSTWDNRPASTTARFAVKKKPQPLLTLPNSTTTPKAAPALAPFSRGVSPSVQSCSR